MRAPKLAWTDVAILSRKRDLDDLIGSVVDSRSPTDTRVSFRADGMFCVLINDKVACIKSLRGACLPFLIGSCWSDDLNAVFLLAPC